IMDSLGLDIPAGRIERYRSFALNHREAYSKFMKALADSSIYPVVFHCQGGKDRAGFASAILGRTLGATHEEIMQDYLTTNLHNYEGLQKMQEVPPSIKSIIGAHAEQMEAAFAAIEAEYGSFDNYLSEGLRLTDADLAAIRDNLR
ncbi:MAG: tyrosine-protein phosphatase, partial [Bacteroidota bacterium]